MSYGRPINVVQHGAVIEGEPDEIKQDDLESVSSFSSFSDSDNKEHKVVRDDKKISNYLVVLHILNMMIYLPSFIWMFYSFARLDRLDLMIELTSLIVLGLISQRVSYQAISNMTINDFSIVFDLRIIFLFIIILFYITCIAVLITSLAIQRLYIYLTVSIFIVVSSHIIPL